MAVTNTYPVQTLVTIPAATMTLLVAANPTRKSLRWMVNGANPMTVVPGTPGSIAAGQGMNYTGANQTGPTAFAGGYEAFTNEVPGTSFYAYSTLGTTVTVWEGQ